MWRLLRRCTRPPPPSSSSSSSSSLPWHHTLRGFASGAAVRRAGDRVPLHLPVGSVHHGFRVLRSVPIRLFDVTVYEMEHEKTKASYIHIDAADTNNAFCVGFRTPPSDDSGLPHILEHTALCGSSKFPIRDPFFHMLRRSLQTFMNAMTGPDYTMYPFSTQHALDFENLLRVYADAAFFPLLKPSDFRQEGVRSEFEDSQNSSSPLVYRGVVYNEMKGALSDAASILYHDMHRTLFPDTAYRFNSGGEPSSIPSLSHEDLVSFHRKHYHPSNARFYTYGDLPPSTQLLESLVLQHFEAQNSSSTEVAIQTSFESPGSVEVTAPPESIVSDAQRQTNVHLSLVCPDIVSGDPVDIVALSLCSTLLISGADSPMHRALIAPNIGSGYGSLTGLSYGSRQPVFSVGVQSIAEKHIDRVKETIDQVLQDAVRDGFESHRVDAILHQHELSEKSVSTNFGLKLLQRMMPFWIHGGDPINALRVDQIIDEVRARMEQGPYLQNILKKVFVDNNHRVHIVQRPDEAYLEKRSEAERRCLAMKFQQLTEQQAHTIVEETKELNKLQQLSGSQPEHLLPTLHRSDIVSKMLPEHLNHGMVSGTPVQTTTQATNGIMYLRGVMDTSSVPQHLKPFIPLYSMMCSAVGAGDRGYQEMSHQRMMYTGGISSVLHTFNLFDDLRSHRELLSFSVSSLARNVDRAIDLLGDTITSATFTAEPDRIRQLLLQNASASSSSIADDGHLYALHLAASSLSSCMSARERYFGLSHAAFLSKLATEVSSPEGLDHVLESIDTVAKVLRDAHVSRLSISADEDTMKVSREALPRFIERVGRANDSPMHFFSINNSVETLPPSQKLFIAAPIDVNHVAMAIPTVPYAHEDSPKLRVLAKLMSMRFLHNEIREKGGAYGGGASWSGDGVFSFFSYRDPERDATVEAFVRSVEWALGKHSPSISEDDIEQALLSIFASLDAPEHPSAKGQQLFIYGVTEEVRQAHRSRLLQITAKDLIDVARRYLSPYIADSTACVAVVGSEQNVPAASDGSWSIRHTSEMNSWSPPPAPGYFTSSQQSSRSSTS